MYYQNRCVYKDIMDDKKNLVNNRSTINVDYVKEQREEEEQQQNAIY